MLHNKKRFLGVLLTFCLCFSSLLTTFASITDNNSYATAYNCGYWKNSFSDTRILAAGQTEAYFKFKINSDDRIYVHCSYKSVYEGMSLELHNANQDKVFTANSPFNVINPNSLLPFLPLDCNGESDNQTYYVRVSRGTYDINQPMYFTVSFRDRIKTGSNTFNFSGTATNSGHSKFSSLGLDSSILSLDLTKNTSIPKKAIVTSVTTDGTQLSIQGSVHHIILPAASTSGWYTSTLSDSASGVYNISIGNNYPVAQVWKFKYNSLALGKSTMINVKPTIKWQYDLAANNYTTFKN